MTLDNDDRTLHFEGFLDFEHNSGIIFGT